MSLRLLKEAGSVLARPLSMIFNRSLDHGYFPVQWKHGNVVQFIKRTTNLYTGWSGGAMVLGKLPGPGRPTIWISVGQGPTALAVGAGGGCLDIFTLLYLFFSFFSLSLGDGPI